MRNEKIFSQDSCYESRNYRPYLDFQRTFDFQEGGDDIIKVLAEEHLLPNIHSFPDMKYSYLFEIKYVKISEYSENILQKKIKEAHEGLKKYGDHISLLKQIGSTKLIKAVLVFCGVELKYIGKE